MELKQNSSLLISDIELHVKVLVIGDPLIGKSDFIASFIDHGTPYETLNKQYAPSQLSYYEKMINNLATRPNDYFKFHIWEISDYDLNRNLIRTYLETTQIVMLCFSFKNPDSLDSLKYWLIEKQRNIRYVLIGLKSNFNNKVTHSDIKDFCKSYNVEFYEFKDFTNRSTSNISLPFIKFLDDIYPKVNIIIERKSDTMFNRIMSYCPIL